MIDENLNILSKFISLPEDERRKSLKKKPRVFLINLAMLCAAKAVHELQDKEEYAAKYEQASRNLNELYDEQARHLQMSDTLYDEVNRLQNALQAAIESRNLHIIANEAAVAAANADTKLAQFSVGFNEY